MPQMAPINWLILFIMFSIIFVMFNMMNYYSFIPSVQKSHKTNEFKNDPMNWKW